MRDWAYRYDTEGVPGLVSIRSGVQPLAHEHVVRSAGEDRREDRPPRSAKHVPEGRGHGTPNAVPADTRRLRGVASIGAGAMLIPPQLLAAETVGRRMSVEFGDF